MAHLALELQDNERTLQLYDALLQIFPNSNYLLSQKAITNYNLRGIPHQMKAYLSRYYCTTTTIPPLSLSFMLFSLFLPLEFDTAQGLFEDLLKKDPYRLENVDIYSNILYVKEDKAKLSFLAHRANETDKYRPETCCIIGITSYYPVHPFPSSSSSLFNLIYYGNIFNI